MDLYFVRYSKFNQNKVLDDCINIVYKLCSVHVSITMYKMHTFCNAIRLSVYSDMLNDIR